MAAVGYVYVHKVRLVLIFFGAFAGVHAVSSSFLSGRNVKDLWVSCSRSNLSSAAAKASSVQGASSSSSKKAHKCILHY